MPRKKRVEPDKYAKDRSKAQSDALVANAPAPQRLARALELLTPARGRPGRPYVEVQSSLMSEFGIGGTTAAEDLRRAYAVIKQRLQETDIASVIRTEMEALARDCHARGERSVASVTWFRLGRLSGLTDESEESQAKKLSDAGLAAAIAAEVALRLERMSLEEIEALVARKKESKS